MIDGMMNDRRSIDFLDEQNHCFLENEKSKKIFIFNIKIFFILEFEKKSVTFFSAKNIFCDIFLAENVFPKNPGFHYNRQHTHIKNCVCVDKKSVKNQNFRLKAV